MVQDRCRHGMDSRWCSACSRSSPSQPAAVRQTTAVRKKPQSRLSYEFIHGGNGVLLKTQVRSAWSQLKKVIGFCQQARISSLRHADLRIQLMILPRWGAVIEAPPAFRDSQSPTSDSVLLLRSAGQEQSIVRELRRRPIRWAIQSPDRLEIEIDLMSEDGKFNPALEWRLSPTGAPTAHRIDHLMGMPSEELPLDASDSIQRLTEYDLQLLLVARPPELRRGPVERAWLQRHFVSGGLPELGKRR